MPDEIPIHRADADDAPASARLLHDFNTEYADQTPGVAVLTERYRRLLGSGDVTVLLAGDGPQGFAQLRFRPSLITGALDAYLEELYVVPDRRGQGIGRALMEAAMDTARAEGAAHMELGTSADDTAAIALYESLGFSNAEGRPDGPIMFVYEREL